MANLIDQKRTVKGVFLEERDQVNELLEIREAPLLEVNQSNHFKTKSKC